MSCELEPSGRRGPDRYNYLFLGSSIPQVVAGDMKPPFPQSMSRGPDCLQPEGNHRNLIVSTRDLIRPGPLLFQFERPGPCKNCPLNPADPRGCKVRVLLATKGRRHMESAPVTNYNKTSPPFCAWPPNTAKSKDTTSPGRL